MIAEKINKKTTKVLNKDLESSQFCSRTHDPVTQPWFFQIISPYWTTLVFKSSHPNRQPVLDVRGQFLQQYVIIRYYYLTAPPPEKILQLLGLTHSFR